MAVYASFVTIIGLALAASLEHPHYDLDHSRELFEEFIATYNKSYDDELEHELRHTIFRKNLKRINEINAASPTSVHAVNQFADLSVKEFSSMYTGFRPHPVPNESRYLTEALKFDGDVPENLDWRKKGVVTSVKDQGKCRSDWALASVDILESQYALKHNLSLVDLSPQQLLDCDYKEYGCDGGWIYKDTDRAFDYLIKAGGAMTLADYPYVATKNKCTFDKSKVKVKVIDTSSVIIMNEDKMAIILNVYGPIIAGIDSTLMKAYHKGIDQPTLEQCNQDNDHSVTIVGYGVEDGVKYWLIKNTWGTSWGEDGYYRLARGVRACGINLHITAATIE